MHKSFFLEATKRILGRKTGMGKKRRILLVLSLWALFKFIVIVYTVLLYFIMSPFWLSTQCFIKNKWQVWGRSPFPRRAPSHCCGGPARPRGITLTRAPAGGAGWPFRRRLSLCCSRVEEADSKAVWKNEGRGLRRKDAMKWLIFSVGLKNSMRKISQISKSVKKI